MSETKFEAQMELSLMQSIKGYHVSIAKRDDTIAFFKKNLDI
jgi:hypothetical protein